MALAQEKLYTIDDIYALPDGERAELIDGELYMMTPPGTTHQRILSHLFTEISLFIREKNGDCDYKKSEEQSMQVAKDNL